MGFARNHKAKIVGGVLAAALVVSAAVIALTSPKANAETSGVEQLCGTAAVGQARCLAERQAGVHALAVSPDSTPGGYGPADLMDAYQLDTTKGFGQTVAIVDAYDDPSAASDLAVYRSQYGLPACTAASGCFQKVNQNGSTTSLPAPDRGWAGEISLDLDMVSAVCPQCSILLVEANSSYMSDLGTAVDTAVRMGAKFVSNSYGGSEYSGVSGNDVHYNHPGVAITASTGDNGYGVSYPASSPYVTAVGGTTLLRSSTARGWSEAAWAGAGSGCSGYESRPSVQTMTGCANRAVADVSAVANPNSGVAVYGTYGGGGWGVYGGTSASAPIIAATYALAGTPGATDYPNSYPYNYSGSLNDVTSGSNGSCSTAAWCAGRVGWDGPTGLGTPNSAAAFSSTGTVDGTPAKFGLIGRVTGSQIAGLPVGINVTPMLPDGDDLASVSWKAARTDCTFSTLTDTHTAVSCPVGLLGSTTVTATGVDTAGVTKSVTIGLTFGTVSYKRPVSVALTLLGQTGSPQSMCIGLATSVRATLTDANSGLPIKGMTAVLTRQSGSATATSAGSALSGADGVAAVTANTSAAVTFTAKSNAVGAFAAGGPISLPINVGRCTPSLSASINKSLSYYGDSVAVTGTLTRAAAGGQIPLPNAAVQITEVLNGKTTTLGTVTSTSAGVLNGVVRPIASGTLTATLPAGTSWNTASVPLGSLTVLVPTTTLTSTADRLDVGYGDAITVSGSLVRNGATVAPLAKSTVTIRSTQGTRIVVLGTATVAANSSYSAVVHPKEAGELSAVYAGAAGLPAASVDLGALTIGAWDSSVTLAAATPSVVAASAMKVTGTVMRSYNGQSSNAPSVPVGIFLKSSTGVQTILTTVSTSATGAFTATVAPTENGTLVAKVHSVPGYGDSVSTGVPITVTTRVVASAPTTMTGGKPVPVTTTLTAARAGAVGVQELQAGSWVSIATGTATAAGRAVISLTDLVLGSHTLRAYFDGDSRGAANVSNTMTVTVKA